MLMIVRAIHFAAAVLVAGTFAFQLAILPRASFDSGSVVVDGAIARRLRQLVAWGLVAAVLSWIVWLGLIAASMSGLPIAQALTGDVLFAVVFRTGFGHVWLLRIGLFALMATELAVSGRMRAGDSNSRLVGACLAGAALLTLAWAGHAIGTASSMRAFHLASDAAHLIAAGLWLGALVPLLVVIASAQANPSVASHAFAAQASRRFSTLGIVAVATLLVSGAFNAWILVGRFEALIDTPYGRLLSIKIVLFAIILGVAAFNRTRLLPRLLAAGADSVGALASLRRNVVVEMALGVLILIVVGALGTTPPSAHEHQHGPMHHHAGSEASAEVFSVPV